MIYMSRLHDDHNIASILLPLSSPNINDPHLQSPSKKSLWDQEERVNKWMIKACRFLKLILKMMLLVLTSLSIQLFQNCKF